MEMVLVVPANMAPLWQQQRVSKQQKDAEKVTKIITQATGKYKEPPKYIYRLVDSPQATTTKHEVEENSAVDDINDISPECSMILERLTQFETYVKSELQKINSNVAKLTKYLQNKSEACTKPDCLPVASLDQLDAFENVSLETYEDVVSYLTYLGGKNLKEVVSICTKEALADDMVVQVTWLGTENKHAIQSTKIVRAIYEAACKNQNFSKPTRAQFATSMKMALRTAQERARKKRKQGGTKHRKPIDFWSEGYKEQQYDENISTMNFDETRQNVEIEEEMA